MQPGLDILSLAASKFVYSITFHELCYKSETNN